MAVVRGVGVARRPRRRRCDRRGRRRADASAAVRALAPRIAALSSRDRETLLLYAWGDLTYEEIAVALGVPVGTVRSRLNRVRRKLAPPGSHASVRLTWIAKEETDGAYGTSA